MILVPTFPIFWDIDSPKTLYINEELKSKIEQSLLEIKDLSLWDDNNSNLVCKSKMDYWELSQEFSETIFLEVGFNIYDILIDKVPVDSNKANKWLEGYMHAEDANVEAQYLLDETSCIIFEEETVADESYMNIAVSIYETCIEDNLTSTSVAFIAKEEEVSDDNKVEILKTYHDNGQIKEEIEAVNGKGHGIYKLYYDNCQLKVAIRYENGHQLDGVVDSFDENGFLIRTVEVKNGNKNGLFKEFYPSGLIKKEGEYKDDEIIGKPIEYFEDGSIKDVSEENLKLNFSDMKLIIKELKIETVLIDFVNNWNKNVGGDFFQLEIERIYDYLASEGYYNGELFSIDLDKENNCLFLEIDSPFEAFPLINELYNYNYLMITKNLYKIIINEFENNYENDVYEELEYTIFTAEDSLEYDNEIGFKSVNYQPKVYMSKEDWDFYNNFHEEDLFNCDDLLLNNRTVHFVSKKEFAEGNWFQTIKSFDLYDWNTYPNEF